MAAFETCFNETCNIPWAARNFLHNSFKDVLSEITEIHDKSEKFWNTETTVLQAEIDLNILNMINKLAEVKKFRLESDFTFPNIAKYIVLYLVDISMSNCTSSWQLFEATYIYYTSRGINHFILTLFHILRMENFRNRVKMESQYSQWAY